MAVHPRPQQEQAVGDYYNVIIFKSANATVSQLARHPELWTRYSDFNDATNDEDGRFLSNWLVDYLNQARLLYDDGKGVASLQNFVELIDNVAWNGFLALRVSVTTQSLPPEIEALLAGIDMTQFVAHHFGNQVNHVTPVTHARKSSRIPAQQRHVRAGAYIDPALGAQVNSLPSYIANPQTYDFKVLTLEAVFENANLVNFSNKSLLTLNSLFGDSVQPTDAAGDAGANTVVLIGSYVANNNPAYTFAAAQGATTDFYVASDALARVEITGASMTVTTVASTLRGVIGELQCGQPTQFTPVGETAYLARFNLAGNLQMAADAFDLLSYQSLGFRKSRSRHVSGDERRRSLVRVRLLGAPGCAGAERGVRSEGAGRSDQPAKCRLQPGANQQLAGAVSAAAQRFHHRLRRSPARRDGLPRAGDDPAQGHRAGFTR